MLTSKRPHLQEMSNGEFRIPPPPSTSTRKRQKSYDTPDVVEIDGIDVITVSGIDLEREQEQLFSGPKGRRKFSLKSSRFAEKENTGAILEKIPSTSKFGISSVSTDAEQCLSLAVKEMLHRLIHNIIRVSKKRRLEESDHHMLITSSDIQQEILLLNQKLEREEKQQEYQELDGEKVAKKTTQADVFAEPQKTIKSICIQDVMTVLKREPEMLKSTLLYCLQEKVKASANAVSM